MLIKVVFDKCDKHLCFDKLLKEIYFFLFLCFLKHLIWQLANVYFYLSHFIFGLEPWLTWYIFQNSSVYCFCYFGEYILAGCLLQIIWSKYHTVIIFNWCKSLSRQLVLFVTIAHSWILTSSLELLLWVDVIKFGKVLFSIFN